MITLPVTLITHGIVAAAAAAGAWVWQANSYEAKLAAVQTEYAQAQARAVEIAHADTIRLQAQADRAQANSAVRARAADSERVVLRRAIERLRGDIATLPACGTPAATSDAGADNSDPVQDILRECVGAVADLAAKADGHASDAMTLREAWPIPKE